MADTGRWLVAAMLKASAGTKMSSPRTAKDKRMRRKLSRVGVVIVAGLLPLVGPGGAAGAAVGTPVTSGAPPARAVAGLVSPVSVHTFYNNKCLDADLGRIAENGTRIQLWDCTGAQQQHWYQTLDNAIHVGYNGRCLEADVNHIFDNGDVVWLWDCNGSLQQQWIVTSGVSEIHSAYSGKCLDADLNTINANGTVIQLWDCNHQRQQLWWYAA